MATRWTSLLFLSFSALSMHASAEVSLRTGDILVQSAPCYLCSLIEIEEGLPYSHAGIFVETKDGPKILQAWGKVQATTLQEFFKIKRQNSKTLILRTPLSQAALANLYPIFEKEFEGHSYDPEFSWTNSDLHGEKYYCSEFIAKIYNSLTSKWSSFPTADLFFPKPMHFTHYREDWKKYFSPHLPPDQQLGISPADLVKNPKLIVVGEI